MSEKLLPPIGAPLMTRRRLLELGAAVAAVAALPAAFRVKSARPAHLYRLETYLPYVGTKFRIVGADMEMLLAEASPADAGTRSFSLLFRGTGKGRLHDAIHTLDHPELGRRKLYLGRVGRGVRGQAYEAIINRRTTA